MYLPKHLAPKGPITSHLAVHAAAAVQLLHKVSASWGRRIVRFQLFVDPWSQEV